jgi:NADH dehydrogenase
MPGTGDGTDRRHRVIVIGWGFGGLTATKALKRAPVDITMIAPTQHHLFRPLLYQVATGILSEGEIAPAIRRILRNRRNAEMPLGDVVKISLAGRYVVSEPLGHRYQTAYDSLVVAAGAGQSYFGNDHFAQFAPGMTTIHDALEVRERILGGPEQAERSSDPARREKLLTFTIVGAGPTGVGLAGQVAELATQTLKGEFRHIGSTHARMIVLDAAPAVLPPMGANLGQKAQARLQKMGVEILLHATVVDVDRDGLTVKDPGAPSAAWNPPARYGLPRCPQSPLGDQIPEQAGTELHRGGRVKVLPDLTVPGHPNVFAIGDMAAVPGVPGMAQGAIHDAKYAALAIRAELKGAGPGMREPFHYFDKGSMATVSRLSAVAKIGPLEFGGCVAWVAWLALQVVYLVGFKSKMTTLISWIATLLTKNQGQLTITERQALAQRPVQPPTQPDAAVNAA